jgi:hypothetical protein
MTKEATTFLLVAGTSAAYLIQRWGHLVFTGNVILGHMPTILPCHFHDEKTKWISKTNKTSNWMTKEATTFLLVVATSSANRI